MPRPVFLLQQLRSHVLCRTTRLRYFLILAARHASGQLGCAIDTSGQAHVPIQLHSKAKVHQHDVARGINEQVFRLKVAERRQSDVVQVLQSNKDLAHVELG